MKTTITISYVIPLIFFDKVIIDTEKQTIHYCSSILGFINDREPVSYTQFDKLKLFRKENRKSISLRAHRTHHYIDGYTTDILLYNDSRSKKLHIKNVGDGEKGVIIAKKISQLINIPFIQNEPKS